MKETMINGKGLPQMTLGTVQLGMNYGIANDGGQPDSAQSFAMLQCAMENGVTSLDTARAYGTSEEVLGAFLKGKEADKLPFLTSKLYFDLPKDVSEKEVEAAMYHSAETSLDKLGVKKLDCLLLHNAVNMTKHGELVPRVMEKMVKENYAAMAGVSVYFPEELDTMLQNDVYQATQIPMSLFDQQLIHKGYLKRMKEKGIVVFVRSVFLQGLFFLDPKKMTDPLLMEYARPYIEKLHEFCVRTQMSIAEFAISFIRDVPGVTSLVLGADTQQQVLENIRYMNAPALTDAMRREVEEAFRNVNVEKIMEVLRRPKQ